MQTGLDLRSLSSGRAEGAVHVMPSVPPPASRWRTRVLVPACVILATVGVLAYSARDAFRPRTAVWVAAVVPKSVGVSEASPSVTEDVADPAGQRASVQGVSGPGAGGAGAALGAMLVQAPGWIEPAPYAISVPALTEGTVKDILVLEGDTVNAGDVVAHLLSEDSVLLLRGAEAMLAEKHADQAMAASRVATAEAYVRVEEAAAAELRDEVARKRELVAAGGIGGGEFRRMEIRLGGLEAKVAAARLAVDEAGAQKQLAMAAVAAAHVAVDEAKLRLERAEVRSPVGGVVLARLVEPGSRISMTGKGGESAGMAGTVLRLYDPANLQVRVDVPLADAAKVRVGTPCTITSEALPDQTFHGSVLRAVHEANIQRNTVQFKVRIENPSPVLKPEMLARVKLHAPAAGGGAVAASGVGTNVSAVEGLSLLAPSSAIAVGGEGAGTVWVIETTGGAAVVRRREVQTATSPDEGFAVIRSGLRLTDRVVLDPPATLADGSPVRVLGERTAASGSNH